MLRSTREEKATEHSFPRDHSLRIWTSPNSNNPGRIAGQFLILPTLVSHSFHLSWRWEEVGVFVDQKRWVHCIFPFSMQNLHEISPFSCHLLQISCMPAAINSERVNQLGEKGRELWADHQQIKQSAQSNRRVERVCDNSIVQLDNIVTITNVTVNKTQQSTNINGSKEIEDSSGN